MKNLYLRSSRPTSGYRRWLTIIGVVLVVLVGATLFIRFLPGPLLGVAGPAGSSLAAVSTAASQIGDFFRSPKALLVANRQQQQVLINLQSELLSTKAQLAEYRHLVNLLPNLASSTPANLIPLRIISLPPVEFYDTLLVDLDSDKNRVPVGALVFFGSTVVGQVTTISGQTGRVELFSKAGRQLEVLLNGQHLTTAFGHGGGNLLINLPRSINVAVGQVVTVPIFNNAVLGVVGYVDRSESEPLQTILVSNQLNFNNLPIIFAHGAR